MRGLLTTVLIGCLIIPGCGQETPPSEETVAQPNTPAAGVPEVQPQVDPIPEVSEAPAAQEGPAAGDGSGQKELSAADDKKRYENARRLFQEMAEAYQGTPAFTDRAEVSYQMKGMEEDKPAEYFCRFDPDGNAYIKIRGYEIFALDGYMYITAVNVEDRCIRHKISGDLLNTIKEQMGGGGGMTFQTALRNGKPLKEILYNMRFGMPVIPRISSYRLITDNDGRSFEQLTLISGMGHVVINVDPETKFIVFAEVEYEPQGAPAGFKVKQNWKFHPEAHEELSEPIQLDTKGMMFVKTPPELHGTAKKENQAASKLDLEPGDEAPDFSLYSLEGQKVTLSDLRGSVVVLDFWASWCVPCRRGLPLLQEFADWAEESGNAIKVYPVNVKEKASSSEDKWQKAIDFWEDQGFEMISLFDPDGTVDGAYGVKNIPVTLVVDPEGKIHTIHIGYDENMAENLKKESQDALAGRSPVPGPPD